ncbi:unnamed protein product, partial [marine sediment metagenome]
SEPVGHDYPGKGSITPGYALPFHHQLPRFTYRLRPLGWWFTLLRFDARGKAGYE